MLNKQECRFQIKMITNKIKNNTNKRIEAIGNQISEKVIDEATGLVTQDYDHDDDDDD